MKKVGIIGGGVSGLTAALYAHKNGASVTVFERKDRVGKKILVTGNGRCNFTNEYMKAECYYTDDKDFVERILSLYSKDDLCLFFTGLGLLIKEKNGYYYPACEQSSFGPTWHTIHDDMAHIDKNTLQAVGQTIIQVLFSEK